MKPALTAEEWGKQHAERPALPGDPMSETPAKPAAAVDEPAS